MNQTALLLLPLLGMVLLTFIISVLLIKLRYRAVIKDGVHPRYFKLNRGAKLPEYLIRMTQHYDNLFETPVLFYVAVLLIISLNINDTAYIILSWSYLFMRVVHAYIHTVHNKLRQRRNSFILSYFILMIIWVRLSIDILSL